jgi:hypothetical protein
LQSDGGFAGVLFEHWIPVEYAGLNIGEIRMRFGWMRSLSTKLVLSVVFIVLICTSGMLLIQIKRNEGLLVNSLAESTESLNRAMLASLHDKMARMDQEGQQKMLVQLKPMKAIRHAYISDEKG